MRAIAATFLLAVALLMATTVAWGQQQCAPGEVMARELRETWGEVLVRTITTEPSGLTFRRYLNERNGSWTLTMESARRPGIQCVIDDGLGGEMPVPTQPEKRS